MQVCVEDRGTTKMKVRSTHAAGVRLAVRRQFRKYTGMKKAGLVSRADMAEKVLVDAPKDAILTEAPADHSMHDEFDTPKLHDEWNTLRVPFTEEMGTTGDGRLTLVGKGSLSNKHELSLVAKRWQAFNFDAEVKVKFDPFNYQQMAGLTNFLQ